MEQGIYLAGISKTELKDLLREVLLDTLKEGKESFSGAASNILDVKEAAAYVKLKVTTLYEKTSTKAIPHFKKGNKVYFRREELEAWLTEGKVKTVDDLQREAATYSLKRKRQDS
jgi:excisionase family DNA binding protein